MGPEFKWDRAGVRVVPLVRPADGDGRRRLLSHLLPSAAVGRGRAERGKTERRKADGGASVCLLTCRTPTPSEYSSQFGKQ
eukprot:scaffold245839_cov21-Tisochrysis_lutea.AAC.1